jgi:hypothetical protein
MSEITIEQLGELIAQAKAGRVNRENLQSYLRNPNRFEIPSTMNIGDRIYDLLSFLEEDKKSVFGHTMVEQAVKMEANLGQEDGQYLLDHQQDIPVALRDKVVFVFPGWCHPDNPENVHCVCWSVAQRRWIGIWGWLGMDSWGMDDRLLRRK